MTRKRWIAALSTLGILIAAALTTAAVTRGGHSSADSPLLAAPAPTTAPPTTLRPTTSTTVKLPKPDPPPPDPYANVPIIQIGSIEIPKIGLLHPIFEGVTLTVIDHGPGHWPGTALPCEAGNTAFPGHRVTHSHPFLDLDLLAAGDKIIFHMPGRDCVYVVTKTQIVVPTDLWVLDPTPKPTATLIACHPKHSAAQRIVVKAKFVEEIAKPA